MHIGSPEQWLDLIDSQVPDIIALVIDTWEALPPPPGDALEDHVSEELCKALRKSRTRCDLPFRIDIQMVELDPAAGQDQGRMDIVFSPTVQREDIYFCLECKRLHVREGKKRRPYYVEYVKSGMLRFIRGQYANLVRTGGMLAYVLDGDISGAITGVESNTRKLHVDLGMEPPGSLAVSSIIPSDTRIRETHHCRMPRNDQFVIHHMFMPGDPHAPLRPSEKAHSKTKRPTTRQHKTKKKGAA